MEQADLTLSHTHTHIFLFLLDSEYYVSWAACVCEKNKNTVCICIRVNDSMCADGQHSVVLTVGVITCWSFYSMRTNVTHDESLCYHAAICSFTPEILTDSTNTSVVDILSISINTHASVVEASKGCEGR